MATRVAACDRTRERLAASIDGRLATAPERSDLVRMVARLILEKALEGEVRDRPGRERHERAEGEPTGYRTERMKTAEGMVEYAAPQVHGTAEPFVSAVRERLAGRTEALEDLAIELHGRGPVHPGHQGHLHRPARAQAAEPGGGARDHRAALHPA